MSNRTYICTNCRTSKRAAGEYGLANLMRCPCCHNSLWELDHKWRIPKIDNDKEWKELELKINTEKDRWFKRRHAIGEQKINEIKSKILSLKLKKENDCTRKMIKQLENKISKIKEQYMPNTSLHLTGDAPAGELRRWTYRETIVD